MSSDIETLVRVAPRRQGAEVWALVLISQGLSPTLRRVAGGYAVVVPAEQAARAEAALSAYQRENPPAAEPAPVESPAWAGDAPLIAALALVGALAAFSVVTGPWAAGARWFAAGAADAERILSGELWRALTALTLHSDPPHVLGNALAGALFLTAVFRALGPGLGFVAVLGAGVAGNLANAVLHGSQHFSVGASTAVFGAVGLLGGMALLHRRRGARRGRPWVAVAASVALLGMLGSGGEQTDLGAHALGLLAGGLLGIVLAFLPGPPRPVPQAGLAALGLAAVLGAWARALSGVV